MKITKTENVKMSWDSFTFPIAVGTPVSNDGVLADNSSAYGLIVRTIAARPDADETAKVMTGGIIDMEEVIAGYGKALGSDAVASLCGIHFYLHGKCICNTDFYRILPTETASGSVVAFDDGADDIPVKALSVAIEPKQSGSGDPSPSNVRPISVWDAVNVYRTGVNIWDEEWEVGGYNTNNGSKDITTNRIRSKNLIPCKPNTSYYFNRGTNAGNVLEYGADGSFIGVKSSPDAFTTTANTHFLTLYMGSSYGTTYNHDISINYPSTDHEYHAYAGQVYPISLTSAGTVYGGTLDVTTGVLTVTHGIYAINNNTILSSQGSYSGFTRWEMSEAGIGVIKGAPDGTPICNIFKTGVLVANGVFMHGSTGAINITPGSDVGSTATEVLAWLVANNVIVCYPLTTTTTYHLTPTEITTLLGNNTLWSDAGDITLTYRADLQKYFEA